MKYRVVTLAVIGLLSAGLAQAQVLATVNGVKIPESRTSALTQGKKLTPEQERALKERVIRTEIIAQAARKKNLQKRPDVSGLLELRTQEILASAYLSDYAKNLKVTDADIKAAYDEQMELAGDKEYKLRHIVVASESDANDIIARLQKGERFATLAQQKSLNKETAKDGGQMGWLVPGMFGEALNGVAKGKFTPKALKTPAGYQILMVEDIRPYKKPTLAEIKPQLEQAIRMEKTQQHIMELRRQAKVQ